QLFTVGRKVNRVNFPDEIGEGEVRFATWRAADIDSARSREGESFAIRRIGERRDRRALRGAGDFWDGNCLENGIISLRGVRAFGDPFFQGGELGGRDLRLVL